MTYALPLRVTRMTEPLCFFCGKPGSKCAKLVRGPAALICDECARLAASIVGPGPAFDPIKACVNCRWFRPADFKDRRNQIQHAMCGRWARPSDGEPEHYCSYLRTADHMCGRAGLYFDPAPVGQAPGDPPPLPAAERAITAPHHRSWRPWRRRASA